MGAIAKSRPLSKAAVQRLRKDMTLAARIKMARQRANLTLDRLGEAVGTSRHHLIRLEKGEHKPKPDMARRIAEATGVPIELLQDEDDEESDPMAQALMAVVRELVRKELAKERVQ